jgi:hypothetical protein
MCPTKSAGNGLPSYQQSELKSQQATITKNKVLIPLKKGAMPWHEKQGINIMSDIFSGCLSH